MIPKTIRQAVLKRDNFECQKCGKKIDLSIHHKNRNPQDNRLKNLISYCRSCHIKQHYKEDSKIMKQIMYLYLKSQGALDTEFKVTLPYHESPEVLRELK